MPIDDRHLTDKPPRDVRYAVALSRGDIRGSAGPSPIFLEANLAHQRPKARIGAERRARRDNEASSVKARLAAESRGSRLFAEGRIALHDCCW